MTEPRTGTLAEPAELDGPARPEPRTSGGLSESEIVAAALHVVRTDGVQKLSMRRLSRELGVSPMAPYYYVADKGELLDLVATAALDGIRVPAADSGTWQQRLRDLVDQIDAKLRRHPGLSSLLIEQMLQKQVDLIAAVMGILADAGFTSRNILSAYAVLHTYLFGREPLNAATGTAAPDLSLPPVVRQAISHSGDLRGRYLYDFGVDTVLAGLEAQLARQNAELAGPDRAP
ncbi:mycofactocin system transcriptional regulator MftR2 [Skermania piniformis]|uniref:Mycofactocin system transcriptional regulator MftR2 n=1 Tax=Skermania pinensis TaxID=39122 RepID=A0ABX8SBF3_9ACTN|nr:mycofactocin system transcriptional regulator MftR2 [Skermania piniformis]QXQ14517.1 mycofactocin system transcriptional regulator MftR2 [Skermania piniformis]